MDKWINKATKPEPIGNLTEIPTQQLSDSKTQRLTDSPILRLTHSLTHLYVSENTHTHLTHTTQIHNDTYITKYTSKKRDIQHRKNLELLT